MAGRIGTINMQVVFTGNGSAIFKFAFCRVKGYLQVVLSNTGGTNFTGGTITVAASGDGVTFDPAAAGIAQFTIGTTANSTVLVWVDKPCIALKVTAASLTGGTNNPIATCNLGAY
jgi:hypothetical protein